WPGRRHGGRACSLLLQARRDDCLLCNRLTLLQCGSDRLLAVDRRCDLGRDLLAERFELRYPHVLDARNGLRRYPGLRHVDRLEFLQGERGEVLRRRLVLRVLGKRRDKPAWRRRWKSSTSKGERPTTALSHASTTREGVAKRWHGHVQAGLSSREISFPGCLHCPKGGRQHRWRR